MIDFDPFRRRIEHHGVAAFEVRGADRDAGITVIQTAEIDQLAKAFSCRAEIIQAAEVRCRNGQPGLEEPAMAEQARIDRAQPCEKMATFVRPCVSVALRPF